MKFPIASGLVDTVLNAGAASAGSFYVNGFAVSADNKLQVDTAVAAAGDVFINGIRCKPSGVIRVATSGGDVRNGGLLMKHDGTLIVEASGVPNKWVNGLPLTEAGRLCVVTVT